MSVLHCFAERLKELRTEKGLSMRELASKIDVSDVAIYQWEHEIRMPTLENVVKIAKFFGVTTDFLSGLEM